MRNLRTEKEIMAKWIGDPAQPLVSICCIAYNQEPYIEDALEGFLIQETDFPFEILIHDDASTDRTADIIREYESAYPNIIKPIYQKENQYSKGKKPGQLIRIRAKGKYIAFCEGDDYWNGKNKLEIQAKTMQKYPESLISFHPAYQISTSKKATAMIMGKISEKEKIISAQEILNLGITFMPTCSLMIKSSFYKIIKINEFMLEHGSSFFSKFLPAIHGGCIYIPFVLSSYRVMSIGSYGERTKNNPSFALKMTIQVNDAFDICDKLTDFKYSKEIKRIQNKRVIRTLDRKDLTSDERNILFTKYKNQMSCFDKMMVIKYPGRRIVTFTYARLTKLAMKATSVMKRF